ncbi:MAG TPA: YlxR family protein [Dehalococcoidia bacterium]
MDASSRLKRKSSTSTNTSRRSGEAASAAPPARKQPLRPRHVPQRTCVICRTTTAKRALVRLVRTSEGSVRVDPTGKQPGRGAYLCVDPDCWRAPGLQQRLGNSLKTSVSNEDYRQLESFADDLAPLPPDAG